MVGGACVVGTVVVGSSFLPPQPTKALAIKTSERVSAKSFVIFEFLNLVKRFQSFVKD